MIQRIFSLKHKQEMHTQHIHTQVSTQLKRIQPGAISNEKNRARERLNESYDFLLEQLVAIVEQL